MMKKAARKVLVKLTLSDVFFQQQLAVG